MNIRADNMDVKPKTPSAGHEFLKAAAIAAGLFVVFAGGALAIQPVARRLFERGFGEAIQLHNMPRLIDAGRRLDDVWRRLDEEITKQPDRMDYRALLGRWTARVEGPQAAFEYFAALMSETDTRESVEPLAEFARVAGLAERWDDCFALCGLLADYGETERLQLTLAELRDAGLPIGDALRSHPGLRFLAFVQWLPEGGLQAPGAEMEFFWWHQMWRLERALRRDGSRIKDGVEPFEDIARRRPDDPRASRLLEVRRDVESPLRMAAPMEFPAGYVQLLAPADFEFHGAPAPDGAWLENGAYTANLPQPANEVWLVARGEHLLHVYPLIIARLDGDVSIHYLHFPWRFPEQLTRADGAPFRRIELIQVNAAPGPDMDLARHVVVQGIYARTE